MTQAHRRVQKTQDHAEVDDDGEGLVGDSHWEDEEDLVSWPRRSRAASPVVSANAYTRPSPRKRRQSAVKGSRKQIPTLSVPHDSGRTLLKEEHKDRPLINQEDVVRGAADTFVAKFSLDVMAGSLHRLKKPFFAFFALLMLGTILSWAEPILQTVLTPLCVLPILSKLPICPAQGQIRWADYPRLMEVETKTFAQLVEGGEAFSWEAKRIEMATNELVALIQISDLRAKNVLAPLLDEFIHDAKKTGQGLQNLASQVGGAVDNIMTVNGHALKSIEAARANEPSRFIQAITSWRRRPTDVLVTGSFEVAINALSHSLERLILKAEVNSKNLQDIGECLNSLHDMLLRENKSEKKDTSASQWTGLFRGKRLRNFDSHLELLKDLAKYRAQALEHVATALQTLLASRKNTEDIRECAAAPNLLGPTIPVEMQMKSIEVGLQSLSRVRLRAWKT